MFAFWKLVKLTKNLDRQSFLFACFSGQEDNALIQNLLSDCNSGLSHVGDLWWCNLFLENVRDATVTNSDSLIRRYIRRYRVMSRIERSYENCQIYDNSQDHWQNQQNLFKVLQGKPIKSYEKMQKITKFTKTAKFTIIRYTT